MSDKMFHWGIMGPGKIAKAFATAMKVVPNAKIGAVASHFIDKANAFADEFGIEKRYGNYEDFLADGDIDAVYIATTNPYHYDCIMACLNAGKPVMCEKPMCLNYKQTEAAIKLAREKGLFLMEAVWSRFLPVFKSVDTWLEQERIGRPELIKADFAFSAPFPEDDRHVDLKNGGGALLDVGVYNLAFAMKYFGNEPAEVISCATKYKTGVDGKSTVILKYADGKMAVLTCAFTVVMAHDATIYGSGGSIYLHDFWHPTKAQLNKITRPFAPPEVEIAEAGFEDGNGYQYEIMEAIARIRAGELESPFISHADSLAMSRITTGLRKEWGVKYEGNYGEE